MSWNNRNSPFLYKYLCNRKSNLRTQALQADSLTTGLSDQSRIITDRSFWDCKILKNFKNIMHEDDINQSTANSRNSSDGERTPLNEDTSFIEIKKLQPL